MPFIIEGADNLGKTTAARRLQKLMGPTVPVQYGHMSRPPESFDFLSHYAHWTSRLMVQDRFHLGALVWHAGVMDEHRLRAVESWLGVQGSIVVVFRSTNLEWYNDRLQLSSRGELFKPDAIIEGNRVFNDIADGRHPFKPRVDIVHTINSYDDFPSDETLMTWGRLWLKRMEAASCMMKC